MLPSKTLIWDDDIKDYRYKKIYPNVIYSRTDLRRFREQIDRMDIFAKYYKREDGMIVNGDNQIVFRPKYIGEYPSILKQAYMIEGI